MKQVIKFCTGILSVVQFCTAAEDTELQRKSLSLDLPDPEIVEAYGKAAEQNVLAAVNPKVFPGYWSVCADGVGFGHGNTYPSLDGHQMTDALLWLGQVDTVKSNWDYVRDFQRPNGQLPLAILPSLAGVKIGSATCLAEVDTNGGLYRHWVPGDPLRALAGPTYIQNADAIYRYTQDRGWLQEQLPSVNLAADFLASLTTDEGAVEGAGYYIERPTRVENDGVAQCYAADAFRRAAELNTVVGNAESASRYRELARRVETHFRNRFWVKDRFAEYIHPQHGAITKHGLTDTDWSWLATGIANPEQISVLWPRLKDERRFYYGGMPTGIATHPETYEKWEFTYEDRMDLAAMGRVWYLEAWARARMGDGRGLVGTIQRVCKAGRDNGYYWRERYNDEGGYGAEKYCEYPANLIRIVQRFLLGVELRLDGTLDFAPTVPDDYWDDGFGQTLAWRDRHLSYRTQRNRMEGEYTGPIPQKLRVRLETSPVENLIQVKINGRRVESRIDDGWIVLLLPPSQGEKAYRFEIEK